MESKSLKKPSHKEWRRLVKKKRRKVVRQKAARERDQEAERVQQILEKREDYVEWQKEIKKLEEEKEKLAREEHDKLEKAWLEAEVRHNSTMCIPKVCYFVVNLFHESFNFRKKHK